MTGDRLGRILAELGGAGDGGRSASRLCAVTTDVIGVTGAGIMLMSGDVPRGSLCSTNDVSALIEELQYTLGEGPCVDAYKNNQVVLEPDLADPRTPRWFAFAPQAVEAGARAVFGFPLRVGAARLGALNMYQDKAGDLSDDQHADALVMADVVARWVLDVQADALPGALADELEAGGEFYFVVHNAAGVVSVQLGCSITEAMIRLRVYAFSNDRLLRDVARDVVTRKLRFG
ncbi:MAG TPA: GAF and ANTAR domain-containing protein [Acidimicrobiales bacterium]|nr:GAF and ANTAR domain-containing protein [Acidimicrobiales bacterium]